VSRAPLANIEAYRQRMGWTIPWFSSAGSDFNVDFGVTTDQGETFGLSVFLRDGDDVYRTYFTSGRGVEALASVWNVSRPDSARSAGGVGKTRRPGGRRRRRTCGGAATTSTSDGTGAS
jgi:hypothetical protein